MKKTIYFRLIKLFTLGLCTTLVLSCNDFLEIEPPSTVSPENYLLSESQLAAYTIRYYAQYDQYKNNDAATSGMLASHWGSGGESFFYDDISTDNAVSRGTDDRFKPGLKRTGTTGGDWNFTNIYALNYYLQTVVPRLAAGEITGNQTNVKHYVGEGYFLRAHEYFYRLRRLGDFPIITRVLPDNRDTLKALSKRQPRNEVARFILQDLDKAIELLNNSGSKTRITKNAALLLKARVALFEGTWEKYHAGTALVPKGTGWPGDASYQFPSGSAENEVAFFLTQAMDASDQIASTIALVPNSKEIRESATQSVNKYYDMFASTDPKGYAEVLMYRSYVDGLGTHYFNHYLYHGAQKGYTHQMEQSMLMDNGLPVYAAGSGYAGDDYIENTKIGRDWRWKLFMKAPNEVKAFINIAVPEKFPNAPVVYSTDGKTSTSTGYMLGKGYSHDYNNQVLGKDVTASVIFRAAEAYLIYIEASYLKNGNIDAKADAYWKAIRTRAGVDADYSKTIAATNMNEEAKYDWGAYSHGVLVDPTLYNIRRERRCELIGEGQRYNDLIRWRAMDQLNGFQIEGSKIWGPMKDRYAAGLLLADQADPKKNTMSSPTLSQYIRPFQIIPTNNNFYNGFFFCEAHYLEPIAYEHFLDTSSDGSTASTSPIYQNPGWPTASGAAPIGY
ncbi:MAG TPA: RagB/SusD family nutrient uptake outer membrane protein [Bacteroidales bacterium]|nr:RagB/SusD family nutrient uptake outer membrane protein [Bacteroidales bacterium]